MQRTALFDLDGTLVDSAPDLHAADRMAARPGLAPHRRDEVPVLIGRALAARGRVLEL